MNHDAPRRIKRLLREYAAKAHEEEVRRALTPLATAFDRWSRKAISSAEICDLIHEFHQGPARDLYVRYNVAHQGMAVAYAIATGILDRASVPVELLEHLSGAIQMYEQEGTVE